MKRFRWHLVPWLAVLLAAANAWAQRGPLAGREPHVGYVYPAGRRQGGGFEVSVGGRYLGDTDAVFVSGEGVEATVAAYSRPPTQKEINDLRNKVQQAQKRVQSEAKEGERFRGRGGYRRKLMEYAKELGVDAEDLKTLEEYRKQRADPKRQLNPQLAETVTVRVEVASDAEPGRRELRLKTPSGLSNPIGFYVGRLPEHDEQEPNDETADAGYRGPLPVVLNGQILPGDVDRFSFEARKGERLVVAASARELIPYLADAVPGWFQATLALYDAEGKELAYADDFRFHPDPVLYYEIPEHGRYELEIRDAIYRGRQDFVYRITLGEVPFVTSVFPMGARDGDRPTVEVDGWNLPRRRLNVVADARSPGLHPLWFQRDQRISSQVPFAIDTLPECIEEEPNDERPSAQRVDFPIIINGRIGRPGDWDVFRFEGRAGEEIVAEVQARRLSSPLDSLLELTDDGGRQLGVNDDHKDEGQGLTTHHADSRLGVTLPSDGTYYVRLGDTQQQGGTAYGYRLRISPKRPDFELRVVPSSVNARPGTSVPIAVYALRRDGFSEDIALELKDAPPGFALDGGWVPAGEDRVRLTLTVPPVAADGPFRLHLEGSAVVDGHEIRRRAVPGDDMMQAFIYRHLVPAEDFVVMVSGGGRAGAALRLVDQQPARLPAGGTVSVRFFTRAVWLIDQIELELSDPPEGIGIQGVRRVRQGAAVVLSAEAAKVEPGLKGNLIVNAFIERSAGNRGGGAQGAKRRFPVGTLPAIPFEIVAAGAGP